MHEIDIKAKIGEIFTSQFPDDDFGWDKKQEEFSQWDSLSHMELIGRIEDAFGIRFQMEEIMNLASPGDFLKMVSQKNG